MKKIAQIASYDFKRLMTNPITIAVLVIVFAFSLIFSATYKIPTTESYSATTSGSITSVMYSNFLTGNDDVDCKTDMDAIVSEVSSIISTMSTDDSEDEDKKQIESLAEDFLKVYLNIDKYAKGYISSSTSYSTIVSGVSTAVDELDEFLTYFSSLSAFQSRMVISVANFEILTSTCEQMQEILASGQTNQQILDGLAEIKDSIESTWSILQYEFHTFLVGSSILSDLNSYLTTAKIKLNTITTELTTLSEQATNDASALEETANTITAYKLTCESLQVAVMGELYIYFSRSYGDAGDWFSYETQTEETLQNEVAIATYYLQDTATAYSDSQVAMNFNIASSTQTAYDATYTIMAIIGFVCILFGIYCAYKLFGSDRKNGKMDMILSQNVTSGQVYSGTVLSIVLCTSVILAVFTATLFLWNLIFYGTISGSILTVFNLSTAYTISPMLFLIVKILGIELQVIFYVILSVFFMNLSRKFKLSLGISVAIFLIATVLNVLCNMSVVWCLFPFIHADLTSLIGGGIVNASFLQTAIYSSGNFFISLAYYAVVVGLLSAFTRQLFRKN